MEGLVMVALCMQVLVHGHCCNFWRGRASISDAICAALAACSLHHGDDLSISITMIATRTKTCFVYGTLMSEEVLHCLLGRIPQTLPQVMLQNHSRHPVREHVYPYTYIGSRRRSPSF